MSAFVSGPRLIAAGALGLTLALASSAHAAVVDCADEPGLPAR
jgi:hypothetical protein